ncbi:YeeE/YedE family protein [Ferrimonas sediminicola]|uniref:YeeE/YedE family protein n=1 Tax=Ferrimonas sediminicola TaxID=2569538 RepID=A0A4U1B9Z9_9GAMM|nr:YeeE/YedE family protein [Ferrimonas sediminicola]TKB47333.1 YeeE/YedE family protein [Ferrimonas sediminicola]
MTTATSNNTPQALAATALLGLTLLLGAVQLTEPALFLRLLLGLSLGFVLVKGAIGFAGSVNRAYRRGSTQLLQTLMLMFVVTAIINAGILVNASPQQFDLWVNPINLGLMVGGLMFGFGMSLSSCCATGVMVEMVNDLPRALVTLLFFGAGVFLGFPLQATQPWITNTLISSASFADQGVFLPDLFRWGPLNGYFMAILLTIALALTVVYLARRYEQHRRDSGNYLGVDGEMARQTLASQPIPESGYRRWLGNLWQMRTAALVIALIVGIMTIATGAGWGASTPFGIWFGKILLSVGVSADALAHFTHRPAALFSQPFFEHGISVQNLAILLGALIAVLLLGQFSLSLKPTHTPRQFALFALGGLTMGLGTRFANGCNVGALFTPIANLSLSGWIYLAFLIAGGVAGNRFHHRVNR